MIDLQPERDIKLLRFVQNIVQLFKLPQRNICHFQALSFIAVNPISLLQLEVIESCF